MRNQTTALAGQSSAEVKATKAIERIQKWMEEKYPRLAAISQSRLIAECLIELTEEKKFLTAQ